MGREITGRRGVDFAEEERQTRLLWTSSRRTSTRGPRSRSSASASSRSSRSPAPSRSTRRILIMDEPTSALSASEVEVLFKVIRDLQAQGVSIVYISHHLEEALQITDHAVVLRDGAMTAYAPRARDRPRVDRAQHGRRELRPRLAAHRLRDGRGRAPHREPLRPLRQRRLFRRRPPLARRPRRRDRLHLRPDGRRPHRDDGVRRRPPPPLRRPRPAARPRRRRASPSPSASPPASSSSPRTASATAWCRR